MNANWTTDVRCLLLLAALATPALRAQTTPLCNGLPATIVATVSGVIMGTPGDDVIVGTAGNDKIFGLGGSDTICGLGGNDEITGGPGTDKLFGQEGNDTFFWMPGDSSDRIEGAGDNDTVAALGSGATEAFELSASGGRVRLFRDVAAVTLDIADVENLKIETRGASDTVTLASLAATTVQRVTVDLRSADGTDAPDLQPDSIFVFGGAGNDQITMAGSGNTLSITGAGPTIQIRNPDGGLDTVAVSGAEGHDQITAQNLVAGLLRLTIEGGVGDDTITGSRGSDALVGGEGDDTFIWSLGLPADLIAGDGGFDTLQLLGSSAVDKISVSAGALEAAIFNGADGTNFAVAVEHIMLQPKSGADQITVNSIAGTSLLQKVTVDLRPSTAVSTGDGYPDAISLNGTNLADTITMTGSAGNLTLSGLAPTVVIQGSDYARDTLMVNAGAETDVINAQGVAADVIRLMLRGGQGADVLTGSLGGDVFTWFPGDSSDVIEGLDGNDMLQVTGSNISEVIALAANGTRLRFTRDVGSVVLDVNSVESVKFAALGGADSISLSDLGATGVRQVGLDLGGSTSTSGDAQLDTISIVALTTNAIATTLGPGTIGITWDGVRYSVTGVEMTNDRLVIQTAAGSTPVMTSAIDPGPTGIAR